jgi:hypothetical protein
VADHKPNCECPPGFEGTKGTACSRGKLVVFFNNQLRTIE